MNDGDLLLFECGTHDADWLTGEGQAFLPASTRQLALARAHNPGSCRSVVPPACVPTRRSGRCVRGALWSWTTGRRDLRSGRCDACARDPARVVMVDMPIARPTRAASPPGTRSRRRAVCNRGRGDALCDRLVLRCQAGQRGIARRLAWHRRGPAPMALYLPAYRRRFGLPRPEAVAPGTTLGEELGAVIEACGTPGRMLPRVR